MIIIRSRAAAFGALIMGARHAQIILVAGVAIVARLGDNGGVAAALPLLSLKIGN